MISAPGKLVLSGEYAVLEGHAGLAMAVGRRVILSPSEHLSYSRLWEAVSQNACEPRFKITSRSLYEGMHKLGLGSSAAAAVCMGAFMMSVLKYKSEESKDFSRLMDDIGALTPRWEAVFTQGYDPKSLEDLLADNLRLLKKLSDKAKITLFTPEQEKIAQVCSDYQAVSKPSGAGGGDITLCFVPPENREDLSRTLSQLGFLPLDLDYFAAGLLRQPEISATEIISCSQNN